MNTQQTQAVSTLNDFIAVVQKHYAILVAEFNQRFITRADHDRMACEAKMRARAELGLG